MENPKLVLTENSKMESAGLGRRISGAIRRMMEAPIIDEKVFDLCLKEIALQTDLHFRDLQINAKNRVEDNCYDNKIPLQSRFEELCNILDPGKLQLVRTPALVMRYGSPDVVTQKRIVMFVGLQGSGKTRACTQFANYYKKWKGFRPAIVSVDTGTSNFDHLMQGTISPPIPLYGSFIRSDPVPETALRGLHWFEQRSRDLIIINTSECHTQVSSLVEEMSQVYEATKPDLVVLVVHSGIGQAAAFEQVQLFKQAVQVGGLIMTNMNYRQQDAETFAAIAATKTPIMFIARGEGLEEFQVFDIKPFLSRLLGLQEILGFEEEVAIVDQDLDIRTNYSLRVYHMFLHMSKKLQRLSGMGLSNLSILNSMETEELDGCLKNLLTSSFISRIAHRSGFGVGEVLLLIEDYKVMVNVFEACDRSRFPVCEYFDKIFPGVIMDNPAIRKKIEAGEDISKPTKEELMEISKSPYPNPWDSKRVCRFKSQNRRGFMRNIGPVNQVAEEERVKKETEDEASVLAALYGKGKPFEAKREVVEGSEMRLGAVVEVGKLKNLQQLIVFYRMAKQLLS